MNLKLETIKYTHLLYMHLLLITFIAKQEMIIFVAHIYECHVYTYIYAIYMYSIGDRQVTDYSHGERAELLR